MDFYVILGVERGATIADVKRAYKRLARRYHPDINPGDRMAEAHFRQIAQAYETLIDPDRRRRYDATGTTDQTQPGPTFGFEGFDFTVSVHGSEASTFGDLFADVFRQRDRAPAETVERGVDLHQAVTVTLEDAIRGGARAVTVTRQEHCRMCRGVGWLNVNETRCSPCHGTGVVKSARGHMVFSKPAPTAAGRDVSAGRAARPAAAAGRDADRDAHFRTAARIVGRGADSGAGQGPRRAPRRQNGDLFITVRVQPHPVFRRQGDDFHVDVPIAIHEAGLGAKVEVPSLDGPARLRVPPGTQSGQRFRLRDRGAPSPRDGRRGDLVVEVKLVLPKLLDERSKELLREFGRINSEDVKDIESNKGRKVGPLSL